MANRKDVLQKSVVQKEMHFLAIGWGVLF